MVFWSSIASLLAITGALAQAYASASGIVDRGGGPDANGKYTIQAQGIRAQFIPYGASISNLFVNDTHGIERDIVVGFDNASYYSIDRSHPHLGAVPGRYANRIKNSTFEIDGHTYRILPNDNNGQDTLHGGPDGWDWRNFTVIAHTTNSVTFMITDPSGKEGFPGVVISYITYTVTPYTWHIRMTANAVTEKTPIMLSSHTYWNLDGFQNPETATVLNHSLHLPYSGQRVGVDGILIPTGDILSNQPGSVNDFWSAPKAIGADLSSPAAKDNCGTGCTGYDTCFLVGRAQHGSYDWRRSPVASLSSPFSGIQVDVFTDQEAFQVYSCNGQNGSLALKNTQGFFGNESAAHPRVVEQYGCVVMEVEDWIDGINQPAWQRQSRQIFGPATGPYVLEARYEFSLHGKISGSEDESGCDHLDL